MWRHFDKRNKKNTKTANVKAKKKRDGNLEKVQFKKLKYSRPKFSLELVVGNGVGCVGFDQIII